MAKNKDLDVKVEYVTRIEGHGNIVVNVKNGNIEKCEFHVVETPRFFEGMLRGRSIFEAQHITSRICGICSCGHSLASIQAAEDALGFKPSEQTIKLRKLLLDYEFLDSHLLHIYLLAAPDVLGVPSFVPLIKKNPSLVRKVLAAKKKFNDVCDILVGRHVHPISAIVGGFTKLPKPSDLDRMLEILEGMRQDMDDFVDVAMKLKFPEFYRETEYVALVNDTDEYPLLEGDIGSSDGKRFNKKDYKLATNEFIDPRSSAKFTKLSRESYMVGALARFNLNHKKLHKKAKKVAEELKLKAPCYNPFMNTIAQVVELVHCYEHAIEIIKGFKKDGIDYSEEIVVGINERNQIPVRAGNGVGAVEVPRGILFHNYEIDDKGIIQHANCIIPTNQNINNLEYDMMKFLPEIINEPRDQIQLKLEMLVRAYDPCISCSTHYLKVDFVE